MNILQIFSWSGYVNAIFSLVFGLFIASRDWKNKSNRLFLFTTIAIAIFGFGSSQWPLKTDFGEAMFWFKFYNYGSFWIPILYFHWLTTVFEFNKKLHVKYALLLGYAVTLVLTFANAFTSFYLSGAEPIMFFHFYPRPGLLYFIFPFVLYPIYLAIYPIFLIIKNYAAASQENKKQMVYYFVGTTVSALGGFTNFPLVYDIHIPPYGNFFVPAFVFFFGYVTVKYRGFGVKVIYAEFLTLLIWSFLLARIFLSSPSVERIIDIIIFLFVLVLGFLLIGTGRREVNQRERLEKLSAQLEDLNDNLEQKVAEQTADVKRAYEVERKARIELEELDKTKDQFILTTQHHLRTPLTIIKGYLGVVEEDASISSSSKSAVEKISQATETLSKFVNELLEVTELNSKRDKGEGKV